MTKLQNRTAIITGGASGIGYETARRFLCEGANVVIADRDDEKGREFERSLSCKRLKFVHTDISNEQEVKSLFEEAEALFGEIGIIVANAAYAKRTDILNAKMTDWVQMIDTNLLGVYLTNKYAISHMLRLQIQGAIVNLASYAAIKGDSRTNIYSASKAGIIGLTRSLAVEYAKFGIRINCISPGKIDTPGGEAQRNITREKVSTAGILSEKTIEISKGIPMGRRGMPAEVASAILFLACDDASFITGVILPVDGGLTA